MGTRHKQASLRCKRWFRWHVTWGFLSVQGVEPVEELTAEQVDALAGGRTLRQQALHQAPPGRVNERMSGRLAAALTQARAPSLHFIGF